MGTYVHERFLADARISIEQILAADAASESDYGLVELLESNDIPSDEGWFYLDDWEIDEYTSHGHGHWLVNGIIPFCEKGSMLLVIEYEGTEQFIIRAEGSGEVSEHFGRLVFPTLNLENP